MTKRNGKRGKRDAGHPGVQSVLSAYMENLTNERTGSNAFVHETMRNSNIIVTCVRRAERGLFQKVKNEEKAGY